MHERTRRNLCRLAFLAFGVLPTAFTLTWLAYRATPWHAAAERAAWEERLFTVTGLLAAIERIEHPGSSTLLRAVTLTDPDGGDRVASIRQIEVARQPEGLVVLLSQPEIAQAKFLRLWDTLHDRVLKGKLPPTAVQVVSGELTLELGRRAQTFQTLRCTVEPLETGPRVWLEFQLAGIEMPNPARIQIDRNRQVTPAVTRWTLQTDTPLPCALFADYAPALAKFGSRATFAGIVETTHRRDGWSSELSGRFVQIDLDQLTEAMPHKLSGLASVGLQRTRLDTGSLVEATGDIVSSGGTIGMSLVSSLTHHLPVTMPEIALAAHADFAPYDQLALRFSLDNRGLLLAGACQSNQRGAILTSRGQPLLSGEVTRPVPAANLVQALCSGGGSDVSATETTRALLSLLLPASATPGEERLSETPRGRLRFSNE